MATDTKVGCRSPPREQAACMLPCRAPGTSSPLVSHRRREVPDLATAVQEHNCFKAKRTDIRWMERCIHRKLARANLEASAKESHRTHRPQELESTESSPQPNMDTVMPCDVHNCPAMELRQYPITPQMEPSSSSGASSLQLSASCN